MKLSTPRIVQLIFLATFVVLFIRTEYRGQDDITVAVNAFFRADPLVLANHLLASWSWTWLLFPALVVVVATMLLGRFFCGWICPLGTLLDLATPYIRKRGALAFLKGNLKNWLLITLLSASLFNLNLAGLLDPIALLVRGLTFFLHPLIGNAVRDGWAGLYTILGEQRDVIAPAYSLVRDNLLPFRGVTYPLALFSAGLLGMVFFLERYESRTWCRNLCPLGTLLGVLGRVSPFRRTPAGLCSDCGACRDLCPTTFDRDCLVRDECILCMSCQTGCPHQRISFAASTRSTHGPLLPERRLLLGGMAAGFLLAFPLGRKDQAAAGLLRPPGVRNEGDFLETCVRCGECMKVCLKNALYPSAWQGGLDAFYTPLVVPRLGYCEFNCTLCGQVCPTGAIPRLATGDKQREVIGKAVFNKDHCLPFARTMDCIVCEEHCPIPRKAIRSREVTVIDQNGVQRVIREPYVVEEICNGCGICENVCPVETRAGIRVHAVRDRRPITPDTWMQS